MHGAYDGSIPSPPWGSSSGRTAPLIRLAINYLAFVSNLSRVGFRGLFLGNKVL